MNAQKNKLSNLQLELLKLYASNISENDLLEIKDLLVHYFAKKATDAANKVWDKKGWTDKDAERMVNTHMRTPYKRKNS